MNRRQVILAAVASVALAAVPAIAIPKPDFFLMPSIGSEPEYRTYGNTKTLIWPWIERWEGKGSELQIRRAKVGSDIYTKWIAEKDWTDGIPPHIQFGGCVVPSNKGDPEFYNNWVRDTKARIACGELK